MRRFPVLAVSIGLGVALLAIVRPAFADKAGSPTAPADAAAYPKVRIDRTSGGAAVEGRLRMAAVVLKTPTGSTTVDFDHVRRVTFQRDTDGHAHDLVQLADKTIVHGQVVAEEFVIDDEKGGETRLKSADVREIKVQRQEKLPLTAILLGLLTLTAMEIILGVDNIIFIAIIAGKLPEQQRPRARKIGLAAALGTRLLLLFSLTFLLGLTTPVFTLPTLGFLTDIEAREVSWRDMILLAGGLFLIGKSTFEMHEKLEHAKHASGGEPAPTPSAPVSFAKTIVTIALVDIVFSLDSVITAIGMVDADQIWVMITAMVISMVVMLYFAGPIANFVDKHPTVKVLALSFLILIGVMLVAEGFGQHMDKGYIYAAMAFAVLVEMVNMQLRKPPKHTPATGPVA